MVEDISMESDPIDFFSAEAVTLLARGQYGWAATHVLVHVLGSLAMTGLGLLTIQLMRG